MRPATYRSLGEQQLSEREERFEKGRRTVGLVLAPLVTIVMLLLPLGLEDKQHTLAAVLLGVVVLWITEPVPIPIGGLHRRRRDRAARRRPRRRGAGAVRLVHGLHVHRRVHPRPGDAQARRSRKRFAMFVLSLPGVGTSTFRVIIAFGVITCLLSAFVSNTATVAMLLPTAIGILTVIAKLMQDQGVVAEDFDPLRLRVGAALMLMLAYGASVGGLLTPVGSPPNLIGRGLIEEATGEQDLVPRLDDHGLPDLRADVRGARRRAAAAQQARDPHARGRRGVRRRGAREAGRLLASPSATR